MTAIEIIGTGKRTRYAVKAVTETGTNPTNGKAYRTEDAARRAAAEMGQRLARDGQQRRARGEVRKPAKEQKQC